MSYVSTELLVFHASVELMPAFALLYSHCMQLKAKQV
jgi:hypothetical protein